MFWCVRTLTSIVVGVSAPSRMRRLLPVLGLLLAAEAMAQSQLQPAGNWPVENLIAEDRTHAVAPSVQAAEFVEVARLPDTANSDAPSAHQYVKWSDGLTFESRDGEVRAHLGVLIQQDWTFLDQSSSLLADPTIGDLQDGVFFRRGRIKFDGKAYGILEWDFDVELIAQPSVTYDDLWFGLTQVPLLGNFRMGHVKIPMGLESVTSNRALTFVERSTTFDAFWQEYDPGMVMFNSWFNGAGTWAACFHRIDEQTDTADFGDGEFAGTFRATLLPWTADDDRRLLHIGASYQIHDAKFDAAAATDAVRFRARPEFRNGHTPGLPRFVDTGTIAANSVETLAAEAAIVLGRFSVQGEYSAAMVADAFFPAVGGTQRGTATFHGWYVQTSYFLTGEHRPYDRRLGRFSRVRPLQNLWTMHEGDCGQKHPCWHAGAWEFAARYSSLDLDDSDILGGELRDVTLGINWYWNINTRWQANYIYTDRDVTAPRADGHGHEFVLRFSFDI